MFFVLVSKKRSLFKSPPLKETSKIKKKKEKKKIKTTQFLPGFGKKKKIHTYKSGQVENLNNININNITLITLLH